MTTPNPNPAWWERAVAGVCSHGGHGWDGETCSDADCSECGAALVVSATRGTPTMPVYDAVDGRDCTSGVGHLPQATTTREDPAPCRLAPRSP